MYQSLLHPHSPLSIIPFYTSSFTTYIFNCILCCMLFMMDNSFIKRSIQHVLCDLCSVKWWTKCTRSIQFNILFPSKCISMCRHVSSISLMCCFLSQLSPTIPFLANTIQITLHVVVILFCIDYMRFISSTHSMPGDCVTFTHISTL